MDTAGGLRAQPAVPPRERLIMRSFRKNFRWILAAFGLVVGLAACSTTPMAPRLPEDPDEDPDVEVPGKPKPPSEDN